MPESHPLPSRRVVLSATAASLAAAAGLNQNLLAKAPTTQDLSPADRALGREDADAPTTVAIHRPSIRVQFVEADHSPLHPTRMKQLIARDLHNDPLPQAMAITGGQARIELADEPIQLVTRLDVPGFGEINCYADNNGAGYSRPGEVDFLLDTVQTRRRRVREAVDRWTAGGVPVSDEIRAHLQAADRPLDQLSGAEKARAAYESLAHALHAGEKLALARARHRISKLAAPRKDFLFGCPCWHPGQYPQVDQAALKLFNFATVSWYSWKQPEPPAARIDYTNMDASINWCLAHNITPKSFGYTYMAHGATPEWVRPAEDQVKGAKGNVFAKDWPFERLIELYTQTQFNTLSRYRDRLKYVEVINEAHDKANLWRLNHQQILEMTVKSLQAARRGSPMVKRQINHCCLWAEYAKDRNIDGSKRWSPYTYLQDVIKAGGEFEVVGLQLYYPRFDLFEIDRMLDRFADFKKPCHITEIACNSAPGLDPQSMRPKDLVPGWHGPWSESMQADWAEAIYTLVYSKPHFEAIGWWDLADTPGHFWPNGALLHADASPKEAYHRIAKLQKDWGVAKTSS